MSAYALVNAGSEVLRTEDFADRPPDPIGKSWRWLPLRCVGCETEDGAGYEVMAEEVVQSVFVPPSPPPEEISDRQFAHALKNAGVITHAEAMAFVQTGTIPPALAAVVAGISDQKEREDAELLLAGATTFQRHHPTTEMLRVAMGWTEEQADKLWRDGRAL